MRLEARPEEQWFARWLLEVGHGKNSAEDGTIEVPPHMVCHSSNDLMNFIYPGLDDGVVPPPEYFVDRSILAARNVDVRALNEALLDRIPGEARTFFSADKVILEAGADDPLQESMPPEYLRTLDASGLPAGELRLKLGCPLIVLRNLAPDQGLCNGTRVILRRTTPRVLEVEIMGGNHNGQRAFIPRIRLAPSPESTGFNFRLSRTQFPVGLAFAMSINKSQGQSLRYVGVHLEEPVFTHGQLYVALSRVTSEQRIKLYIPRSEGDRVKNIVFPEILQ
jgi:ATP-dependent exoDNAse (exonuclease V) alpha subunit